MKRKEHEAVLYKLLSGRPDSLRFLEQVQHWASSTEIRHDDDREVTLVAFTLLEDALKVLLMQHFGWDRSEKSGMIFEARGDATAILGTASSRATMAVFLGLIEESVLRDIKAVNLVRNVFAHSAQRVDYSQPSIASFCNLETLQSLGNGHTRVKVCGPILLCANFTTPRSKILCFIIMLFFYCGMEPHRRDGIFKPVIY